MHTSCHSTFNPLKCANSRCEFSDEVGFPSFEDFFSEATELPFLTLSLRPFASLHLSNGKRETWKIVAQGGDERLKSQHLLRQDGQCGPVSPSFNTSRVCMD